MRSLTPTNNLFPATHRSHNIWALRRWSEIGAGPSRKVCGKCTGIYRPAGKSVITSLAITRYSMKHSNSTYRSISQSHNVPVPYPTTHHFVTEMCTRVYISVTKRCIVGYLSDAFHTWDLWDWIDPELTNDTHASLPRASCGVSGDSFWWEKEPRYNGIRGSRFNFQRRNWL